MQNITTRAIYTLSTRTQLSTAGSKVVHQRLVPQVSITKTTLTRSHFSYNKQLVNKIVKSGFSVSAANYSTVSVSNSLYYINYMN